MSESNVPLTTKENDDEWSPKGNFLGETHYIVKGLENNPLVVMCHGIDGYHYNFDKLCDLLVLRGFKTLQYDMLGRGYSRPHSSNLYGMEQHLDQLHQLLMHLQFITTPFHLIGLSMGGAVAALYSSHYPEEIKSLTLLAPAGLMNIPDLVMLKQWRCFESIVRYPLQYMSQQQSWSKTFFVHDGIFKEREDYMFRKKLLAMRMNPHHLEASWQCVMQFPLYDIDNHVENLASQPDLPVHLIFGDKDVVVNYEYNMNRWRKILDNGKCKPTYTILPNAGHNILMEFPDESNKIISDYLLNVK
jgi:pimeloyl-ACP methyl ester carboxylesterase